MASPYDKWSVAELEAARDKLKQSMLEQRGTFREMGVALEKKRQVEGLEIQKAEIDALIQEYKDQPADTGLVEKLKGLFR